MTEFCGPGEQAMSIEGLIQAARAAGEQHHVTVCIAAAAAEWPVPDRRRCALLLAGLAARAASDPDIASALYAAIHCAAVLPAVDDLAAPAGRTLDDGRLTLGGKPARELWSWLQSRADVVARYASDAKPFLGEREHSGLLVLVGLASSLGRLIADAPDALVVLPLPNGQPNPSVFAQAMWILAGELYDAAERGRACPSGAGPGPVCDQFADLAFGLLRCAAPLCADAF